MRRFIENGVGLVAVAAPGYDHGKVVAGVIGSVSEITAHNHGGVVEQGTVTFLDLIHFEKKAVEVFESVDLDLAQAFDFFGLATMMRERMPTSGGPGTVMAPSIQSMDRVMTRVESVRKASLASSKRLRILVEKANSGSSLRDFSTLGFSVFSQNFSWASWASSSWMAAL